MGRQFTYADLTVGLVEAGEPTCSVALEEVRKECLRRDNRFAFRKVRADSPTAEQDLVGCGFAVAADYSEPAARLLAKAMDRGVIPVVRAGCGWDALVPATNLWKTAAAAAGMVAALRETPESFRKARSSARSCGQPESNGCRYYERSKVKIGIICDLFYWDSMKAAADFVYVTPQDWREKIATVDCFLYVTAWRGVHGEWPDLFHEKKPNRLLLYEIIDTCRKLGKPTIFYSKEDPPHYAESLNIARRCDYVFTTCAEIIPQYKADCGHDRVRSLCFGINPAYHNPVGMRHRKRGTDVIFSGSWSVRYPKRCAELGAIFDGVLASGRKLDIIDRNYDRSDNPDFALPARYRPYQRPSLDHDSLQREHKTYDWAVNINTVQDSRTMFANRTYELQAAGNLLLSNDSIGVAEKFPGVFIVRSPEDVVRVLGSLSPQEVYERQVAGVRRVMTGETCYDRLAEILEPVGLGEPVPRRRVAVVVQKATSALRAMFECQGYPDKVMVEAAEAAAVVATCDLVAFFGDDAEYGPHYLEDMIDAFKYTDSDFVTKEPGREHVYVDSFGDKTRTVFWRRSFDVPALLAHEGPMAHGRGYSVDPFNYRSKRTSIGDAPGVSVVIPTWRENPYVKESVRSALEQNYPPDSLEVLVAVNGGDSAYRDRLAAAFASEPRVRVLFTERKGANAGRNIGVAAARFPLIAFLDDDDTLTRGFVRTLAAGFSTDDVNVSVGRLAEVRDGGVEPNKAYAAAFRTVGRGPLSDYRKLSVAFSSFPAKLYRTEFFRKAFGALDESEAHSEDVIFWAENIGKLTGRVFVSDPESDEYYLRRVRPDSLSRPSPENEYAFYVTDRLHVMDRLAAVLVDPSAPLEQKDFVLGKLRLQQQLVLRFMQSHLKVAEKARQEVLAHDNPFLNKALFARRQAIAFCHNFSPYVDASAFVATKRLREIEKLEGGSLRWHVVSQDMDKVRTADPVFHRFYAEQVFWKNTVLHGPSAFMPELQVPFGNAAFRTVADEEAEVVYSRSLFVGSHIAAYHYKKAHPKAKWYAEFSDPAAYGVDNKPRACKGKPDWFYIEQMVYVLADQIIFTNANQMEFMLSYNPRPELNARIRERALVMHHPVMPRVYCNIVGSRYALDPMKINVGYFGTFYVTRKADDMLKLLDNPRVVLHIFTTKPEDLKVSLAAYGARIRINPTVSPLEMLNLGAKMDYLYLNDTVFPGKVNPFLPSKYADYLATGTPIIALVQKGSVLDGERRSRLLKTTGIDAAFVGALHPKRLPDAACLGVSVIIPTWRKNATLARAVRSVFVQDYPAERLTVFLCVNGGDRAWADELGRVYADEPRVKVLFTEKPGPNAGRNLGLRAAKSPTVTFLDDDDTLTPGYFRALAAGFANPKVTISFGRMVDRNESTKAIFADTYINRALQAAGVGDTTNYVKASSLLSTLCGKMYQTDFFRDALGLLEEEECHTEDMLFWAERFDRLAGTLHMADAEGTEAYVRHVTKGSLSRPDAANAYAFYVTDRIRIIRHLQDVLAAARLPDHRKMLESKLRAQKRVLREYIAKLSFDVRRRAEKEAGDLMQDTPRGEQMGNSQH